MVKVAVVINGFLKGKDANSIQGGKYVLGIKSFNIKNILPTVSELSQNREHEYLLGRHGKISFLPHVGKARVLSDGTNILPGSRIGNIDLIRNLSDFEEDNTFETSRWLLLDFLTALIDLAEDVKSGEFPEDVVALTGLSHLAGTGFSKLLRFDVVQPSYYDKLKGTITGLLLSKKSSISSSNLLKLKWEKSQRIYVSIKSIVNNADYYRKLFRKFSVHA